MVAKLFNIQLHVKKRAVNQKIIDEKWRIGTSFGMAYSAIKTVLQKCLSAAYLLRRLKKKSYQFEAKSKRKRISAEITTDTLAKNRIFSSKFIGEDSSSEQEDVVLSLADTSSDGSETFSDSSCDTDEQTILFKCGNIVAGKVTPFMVALNSVGKLLSYIDTHDD